MSNDLVSVIVPVYNAEKTIQRCIESILVQTYHDFELILVDDGSSDRSGQICDKYAEKDSRIRVIHTPNGGVSHARNTGLDCAKGKYVLFVDSDDWIEKTRLQGLLPETDEDYVYGSYCNVKKGKKEEMRSVYIGVYTQNELRADLGKCSVPFVWCSGYRRDLIEQNRIRFDESICLGEDILFNIEYLRNCKKVRFSGATDYNHACEAGSLVHRYYPNRIGKEERECRALERFIDNTDLRLRWYHWHVALGHYEKWMASNDRVIAKNANNALRNALNHPYFHESIGFIKKNGSLDERIEAYFMYPSLRWIGKAIVGCLPQIQRIKGKLVK